eukprot:353947-Chlamydomonas_euryale.AAC.3
MLVPAVHCGMKKSMAAALRMEIAVRTFVMSSRGKTRGAGLSAREPRGGVSLRGHDVQTGGSQAYILGGDDIAARLACCSPMSALRFSQVPTFACSL